MVHILPYVEEKRMYDALATQLADHLTTHLCLFPNGKHAENSGFPPPPQGCPFALTTPPTDGRYCQKCSVRNVRTANGYAFNEFSVSGTASPAVIMCPSYDWSNTFNPQRNTNYAGSMGPQCMTGACSYNPNDAYCDPRGNNLGDWGYEKSVDAGQTFFAGNARSLAAVRGLFNSFGARITFAHIKDGHSNTIMLGEVRPACHDRLYYFPWTRFQSTFHLGSTIVPLNTESCLQENCSAATTPPEKRQISFNNWNVSGGFKSMHPGGVNFVFADGSVHFLSQDINHMTYQQLGCRDDQRYIAEDY